MSTAPASHDFWITADLKTPTSFLGSLVSQQVVKVIWQEAASPPHMHGSIVFVRWRQCAPSSNTCFLGPTPVHIANGISIGSAVSARLTVVADRQTDRPGPTDRPLYSVCNNTSHLYLRSRPSVELRCGLIMCRPYWLTAWAHGLSLRLPRLYRVSHDSHVISTYPKGTGIN